jgi:hypothetical protein
MRKNGILRPSIPKPTAQAFMGALQPSSKTANEKQTSKLAVKILLELNAGFHRPTQEERNALLVGFAMRRKVLYRAAFDLIRLKDKMDLTEPSVIASSLELITAYEIKSTNKAATKSGFGGYFFDLTTAELLVAQSLGDRYRFAFVNTISHEWIDMALSDIISKTRKIYPKWAISF